MWGIEWIGRRLGWVLWEGQEQAREVGKWGGSDGSVGRWRSLHREWLRLLVLGLVLVRELVREVAAELLPVVVDCPITTCFWTIAQQAARPLLGVVAGAAVLDSYARPFVE